VSKQTLGKGLNSLLDETKPVTLPAESPANERSVASNGNGIEAEKVKSNGLKVLLTSPQSTNIANATLASGNKTLQKENAYISSKKIPFGLLILTDAVLIVLAFAIIMKSGGNPSMSEILLGVMAISVGAALICWGYLDRKKSL
jgi:hypothetical protein